MRSARPAARGNTGFTLLELIVVVLIIGVASTLMALRLGTFTFWEHEGFIRKLSETIAFLHHHAVVDQTFYRMEFNFEESSYSVGAIQTNDESTSELIGLASELGILSVELAAFMSPSLGKTQTIVAPPSFPSLAEPVIAPRGVFFQDIRTMRGKQEPGDGVRPYIIFSPRGFSEFSVIHIRLTGEAVVTILVNPFTGNTEIIREYKDYEWTYGRTKKS